MPVSFLLPSIEQEFSSLQCSSTAGIGYKTLKAGKIVKIVIPCSWTNFFSVYLEKTMFSSTDIYDPIEC